MYANSPVNASLANAPMYGGGGYGYCGGGGHGKSFAIIVVLFILLIIVGTTWAHIGKDC